MASSLKLSELPVALSLEQTDILLVADIQNAVSKKIQFGTLNSLLNMSDLADYQDYTDQNTTINDLLNLIIGSDTNINNSLSDLKGLNDSVAARAEEIRTSLTNLIDTVKDNLDTEIINRNQMDAVVVDRVDIVEDHMLQAGLATGYLYVETFQGG